ncbi:MAG: hypothetical protein U1E73_11830 [Planctomycetota bacterium]
MTPIPTEAPHARWPGLAIFAAATALLGVGIAAFWPWISDDAFIALRYSERLWQGEGLTWNDGPRVEGYSNFLWIVLCTALRPTGLGWIAIAQGLGIAATVATFAVFARTPLLRSAGAAARGSVLLLAATAPVGLWAIGGLEGPLTMLLVALAYVRLGELLAEPTRDVARRAAWIGAVFVLLVLCRSEGPLWVAFAAAAVVLFGRRGPDGARHVLWKRLLWIVVPPALATLGHLAFRLAYYGEWVPNTAHAKLATSAATLRMGAMYVGSAAHVLRGLWLPAVLGFALAVFDRRLRPIALLCMGSLAVWVAYVLMIGGDWYPLGRYLQGGYGLCVLLAGLGLTVLARVRFGAGLGWLVVAASVGLARWDARLDDADAYQRVSHWEWRGKAIGEWLGRAFAADDPLLALDPAGAVPFFSRLRCLDMLGLCDGTIAKTPPPRPEHIIPAHSRGNPRYVLDHAPDLLLFGTPIGELVPRWPGGWQMEEEEPRFLADYRCAMLFTGPLPIVGEDAPQDLEITLRVRTAGRLGVRTDGDTVRVPGWLLTTHRQPVPFHYHEPQRLPKDPAQLGVVATAAAAMQKWWQDKAAVGVFDAGASRVVAEVRKPGRLLFDGLALAPGTYEVVLDPLPAGVSVEVLQGGAPCERRDGRRVVTAAGPVDIAVDIAPSAALPLRLAELRCTRRD